MADTRHSSPVPRPPVKNVVLIHTDQQRWDSLGCAGNPCARTPNVDRLAASGTLFTRHVVSNPICSPSRASLLTGLYPPGHGVWCNGVALNRSDYAVVDRRFEGAHGDGHASFQPEPPTMADLFAAAGYDTASFGKLHLTPYLGPESYGHHENTALWNKGVFNEWHGPYYGFRHVEMALGHGEGPCHTGHYGLWLQREHPEAYRAVREGGSPRPIAAIGDLYVSSLPYELHHSAWLADRFCSYLQAGRPADQPFFAFIGFPDPHHPFTPCHDVVGEFEGIGVPDPVDPEGRGVAGSPFGRWSQQKLEGVSPEELRRVTRYTYAMVHQIDRAVGKVLGALEEAGLAEETIVVFTSDHGDFLGDHGYLRKGFAASDSLLHVPLIIRAPGSGLPSRVDSPASNCDVMPTVAALAGVPAPAWQHGEDLGALLREGRPHYAFAFSANGDPKAINHTVYDATHRLTWYPGADHVELFDHATDPGECRNVAALPKNRDRVRELMLVLAAKLAECYNPILARTCAW